MLSRESDGVVDGLDRNLELEHDAIDGFQQIGGSIHAGRLHLVVRALHHQDSVLSVGLDKNGRHAAGYAFHLPYMGCVDSQLLEIFNRGRTEEVAAYPRHHEYSRSAKLGRYCLIGALAPEAEIEFLAEDSFAGLGETVGKSDQVNIRAAHHRNSRNFRHDSGDLADRFDSVRKSKDEEGRVYSAARIVSTVVR